METLVALWQFEECTGGVLPSVFIKLSPNEKALITALFLDRMKIQKLKTIYPRREL